MIRLPAAFLALVLVTTACSGGAQSPATSLVPGPSVGLSAICSAIVAAKTIHEQVNSFMAADKALDVAGLGTFHQATRETMLKVAQELNRADPADVLVGSIRNWMLEIDHAMTASESYLLFQFDAAKGPAYGQDAVYWFDTAANTWTDGVVVGLEISPPCE